MSVTLYSDVVGNSSTKQEPCLCAQMSDYFSDFYDGKDSPIIRTSLKENANPNCPTCKGLGIEAVETDDAPTINLANENAQVLFNILGVDINRGEMTLPEARRALMKALSRKSLKEFVREQEIIHGKPREISPGVVDLKPMKMFHQGLSEDNLKRYVERFTEFLRTVSERGGKKITWY